MFLIVESLNKDWKATSRNIVRNFNKDLLPEEVKFYLIYYFIIKKIFFLKRESSLISKKILC